MSDSLEVGGIRYRVGQRVRLFHPHKHAGHTGEIIGFERVRVRPLFLEELRPVVKVDDFITNKRKRSRATDDYDIASPVCTVFDMEEIRPEGRQAAASRQESEAIR